VRVNLIAKFLGANFATRLFGFGVDLYLVYFAAQAFAASYYVALLAPTLMFSVIAYQSAVFRVTDNVINMKSAFIFALICIGGTAYTFHISESLDVLGWLLILCTFIGLVLYYFAGEKSDDVIWIGPVSWVLLPACCIVFALFLSDIPGAAQLSVITALMLRTCVILSISKPTKPLKSLDEVTWFVCLIMLLLLSIRLLVSLLYRMALPDTLLIDYSFNSRLALNFYAFLLIPMFIKYGHKISDAAIVKMLVASIVGFVLSMTLGDIFLLSKFNLNYLTMTLCLVPLVFVWDRFLFKVEVPLVLRAAMSSLVGGLIFLSSVYFYPIAGLSWLESFSGETLFLAYLVCWVPAIAGARSLHWWRLR